MAEGAEEAIVSELSASVSIFDQAGGETTAEGLLMVTPGGDPGTVALWIGQQAGIVVNDADRLMAALRGVPQGA